jgi:hypothetical protein
MLGNGETPSGSVPTEIITHTVKVSRELLPKLREWSEPMQVRITGERDGVLQMEFRRVTT